MRIAGVTGGGRIEVMCIAALMLWGQTAWAQATLSAPAQVAEGAYFNIDWAGPGSSGDQIVIVPQGASDGTFPWSYPAFPKTQSPVRMGLNKKVVPGAYELRYVGHPGSNILARRSINVVQGVATITFPPKVLAGSQVEVNWTGPGMEEDKIAIGKTSGDERYWKVFSFVDRGNPLSLRAPAHAGKYHMRYYMGHSAKIIAAVPFEIVDELPPEEETLVAEADIVGTEQVVDPAPIGALDDETVSSTEQTVQTGTSGLVLQDEDESAEEPDPAASDIPRTVQAGTLKFHGRTNLPQLVQAGVFRFHGRTNVTQLVQAGAFRFHGRGDTTLLVQAGALRFHGRGDKVQSVDIGTFKFTGTGGEALTVDIGTFKFTGLEG